MSTLTITRGLPGSGKTTYAKRWLTEGPGRNRVNRDDLRRMLAPWGTYAYDQATENIVTSAQESTVRKLLEAGRDVIVDDMNLRQQYARRWLTIATSVGADFAVVDLTNVPTEECITRDMLRPPEERVGRGVILHQARFVKGKGYPLPMPVNPPKPENGLDLGRAYVPPTGKPSAIIVDIDGTFALMNGRGPHEYHRVGEDLPNKPIVDLVDWLTIGFSRWTRLDLHVIFMSGRNEKCRPETEDWLAGVGYDPKTYPLFMRPDLPDGVQQPKDSVVKLALFDEHVRDHYDVQLVLDDRDQVVEMWRSLGLTCLQVADGAF
jgi:predicted kinase